MPVNLQAYRAELIARDRAERAKREADRKEQATRHYRGQALDLLAREWADYAADERVGQTAGVSQADVERVAQSLGAKVARQDAWAEVERIELPAVQRRAVKSEGRRLCEPGCECVLCHRPGKDLGERIATTGRPVQARNLEREALADKRAAREAAWEAKRARRGR